MEASPALKKRLFELKQRFVESMPDRIAAIASTLSDCREGRSEATDRLERQFHTLGGTAGTYDLRAVAAVAFEGEEACNERNRSLLDSDYFAYVAFLVEQLPMALIADGLPQWTGLALLAGARSATPELAGVSTA